MRICKKNPYHELTIILGIIAFLKNWRQINRITCEGKNVLNKNIELFFIFGYDMESYH